MKLTDMLYGIFGTDGRGITVNLKFRIHQFKTDLLNHSHDRFSLA